VRLTAENYTSTVLEGPRDYTFIVLFTASEARFGCAACGPAAKEMRIAAQSFARAHGVQLAGANGSALSTASHGAASVDDRTVFFGVVDFKFNNEAFVLHGFQNVPHFVLFEPTRAKTAAPGRGERVPIPKERLVSDLDGSLRAEDILAKLLPPSQIVPVVRPASERYTYALLATVTVAAFGIALFIDPSNVFFFRKGWFWLLASFLTYAISISGAIGCVIKLPPWYGTGAKGEVQLFSGGGGHHDQYVLEGLVIGALNVAAALAAVSLVCTAKSTSMHRFSKVVLAALALGVFVAVYLRILGFYTDKTRWYQPSNLVSEHFRATLAQAWAAVQRTTVAPLQPHWRRVRAALGLARVETAAFQWVSGGLDAVSGFLGRIPQLLASTAVNTGHGEL
jgi:oligosaccharyltransferase complex subunit gamma